MVTEIRLLFALRNYHCASWYEESKSHIVDEALANSGHKCSECGSSDNLQIHHEDHKGHNVPKRDRNNSIENLHGYCSQCH